MEMWWLAPPDMHAAASPAGAVWGLVSLPLTPLCGHWCYRTSLSLLGFILRMPVTLSLLWCYRTPSLSLPLSPLHPTDGGNATLVVVRCCAQPFLIATALLIATLSLCLRTAAASYGCIALHPADAVLRALCGPSLLLPWPSQARNRSLRMSCES